MSEQKMELEDWLDDLCVRFIINLPAEDLSSVARICFQVEEAQWFYEDFIRPLDPTLPSMSLRSFCLRIFQHCPLLSSFSVKDHMAAFEDFLTYKTRVPVRGAIMLNAAMDSAVLVKGWKKGANWSFPRGKINKDEDDLDCAIREVYEETGFDIRAAGLVPRDEEVKYIEITMREQQLRLYVFRNVPMDTHFEPKTRKEISKIQWYKLSDLPAFRKKGSNQQAEQVAAVSANKFYMVAPFLVPLKKWVVQQKKRDAARGHNNSSNLASQPIIEEGLTEDDTEPVRQRSAAGPADNYLDTTRELQRLLNVQPSGQGLDVQAVSVVTTKLASQSKSATAAATATATATVATTAAFPAPAPAHHGQPGTSGQAKGRALLAILQQPKTSPFPAPHTPLDLIHNTTPAEPRSPHHHHPTQLLPPAARNAPPPSFGLSTHTVQSYMGAAYDQHIPTQLPRNPNKQAADYAHGAQPHGQQHPESEALLHPQPQPPQVQGLFPFPGVADPSSGVLRPQGLQNPTRPHEAYTGAQLGPEQQPGGVTRLPPPPQLTDHSMALLNALRGDGARSGDMTQVAQLNSAQARTLAHTQPPIDKHRSTLLDMLKPQVQTATERVPIGAVDGSDPPPRVPSLPQQKPQQPRQYQQHQHQQQHEQQHQNPYSQQYQQQRLQQQQQPPRQVSNAETIRAAAEANGGPIPMDPNLNLPFRALKLLSRPKGLERGDRPEPANGTLLEAASSAAPASHHTQPQPQPLPQLPPQAGRVQDAPGLIPSSASGHAPAFQGSNSQAALYNLFNPNQRAQPAMQGPQASAEQKTRLLSLFGKPQATSPAGAGAVGLPPNDTGKGTEPPAMAMPPPVPAPAFGQAGARSQGGVGIAPSPGEMPQPQGDDASRRGSQAPISPADRSFLLSFLQSVTNSATQ